jgi:hypothetical protein
MDLLADDSGAPISCKPCETAMEKYKSKVQKDAQAKASGRKVPTRARPLVQPKPCNISTVAEGSACEACRISKKGCVVAGTGIRTTNKSRANDELELAAFEERLVSSIATLGMRSFTGADIY